MIGVASLHCGCSSRQRGRTELVALAIGHADPLSSLAGRTREAALTALLVVEFRCFRHCWNNQRSPLERAG